MLNPNYTIGLQINHFYTFVRLLNFKKEPSKHNLPEHNYTATVCVNGFINCWMVQDMSCDIFPFIFTFVLFLCFCSIPQLCFPMFSKKLFSRLGCCLAVTTGTFPYMPVATLSVKSNSLGMLLPFVCRGMILCVYVCVSGKSWFLFSWPASYQWSTEGVSKPIWSVRYQRFISSLIDSVFSRNFSASVSTNAPPPHRSSI